MLTLLTRPLARALGLVTARDARVELGRLRAVIATRASIGEERLAELAVEVADLRAIVDELYTGRATGARDGQVADLYADAVRRGRG